MEILKGEIREKNRTHYPKTKRQQGKIPGVLYGATINNMLFEVGELELNKEINKIGEHGTIELEINNEKHKTLIKELQREPVTHKIVHIDLEAVNNDKVVQTEIPLVFTGEKLAAKNGGIIQKERSSVKVQGKFEEIPKSIEVNLSTMNIGQVYRVADLEIAREISIVDDLNTVIAAVSRYSTGGLPEEEDEDENNEVIEEK
ncbi:50S ribosomal protein L25 [Clostridium ganghwense]|uniref:Large ribosomal subunit protein bL25 n=1 Tax=Clostridium ganghwense TaxID=312089 RepID=A0ABT4CN88_9CLOT|nr:50S ribosomal protein L25 [Clostridium ganghwense]MCY6370519.1 50S ribosomal protein L25 [Clostridium ganghwense]